MIGRSIGKFFGSRWTTSYRSGTLIDVRARLRTFSAVAAGFLAAGLALADLVRAQAMTYESRLIPRPGLVERDSAADPETPEQAKLEREFADGRFEQARATAEGILTRLGARFGQNNQAIIPALVNLATVLQRHGDLDGAIQNYERAVRVVESRANRRNLLLARPLYGLGLALLEARRYSDAVTVLQRAVFVRRTNLGLHSLEQLEYYDAWMESLIAVGRYEDAGARQLARLAIVELATGAGSPELLFSMEDACRWMALLGRYREERALHQRRLSIIVEEGGEADPRQIPVLRDLARTYAAALEPNIRGVASLRKAINLQEEQPDTTPAERAELLAALGDYYLMFPHLEERLRNRLRDRLKWGLITDIQPFDIETRDSRAYTYYARARELLAEDPDVEAIDKMFGRPQLLFAPTPSTGNAPPESLAVVEATVRLTVTSRGKTRNAEILDLRPQNAPKRVRTAVLRSMRNARFRPQISTTRPVATQDVQYRFRFRYVRGDA